MQIVISQMHLARPNLNRFLWELQKAYSQHKILPHPPVIVKNWTEQIAVHAFFFFSSETSNFYYVIYFFKFSIRKFQSKPQILHKNIYKGHPGFKTAVSKDLDNVLPPFTSLTEFLPKVLTFLESLIDASCSFWSDTLEFGLRGCWAPPAASRYFNRANTPGHEIPSPASPQFGFCNYCTWENSCLWLNAFLCKVAVMSPSS